MTRRSLSPKERATMLEAQEGRCAKRREPIGPQEDGSKIPFIAEHSHPVALGTDQKPDFLLFEPCAALQPNGTRAPPYGRYAPSISQSTRLRGLTKPWPKKPLSS